MWALPIALACSLIVATTFAQAATQHDSDTLAARICERMEAEFAGTQAIPSADGIAESTPDGLDESTIVDQSDVPADWIRLDVDNFGTQIWAGGYLAIGEMTFSSTLWAGMTSYGGPAFGQLTFGPTWTRGAFYVEFALGFGLNFAMRQLAYLVGPVTLIRFDAEGWRAVLWHQLAYGRNENQVFRAGPMSMRTYVTRKIAQALSLGVQGEATWDLRSDELHFVLRSSPIGVRAALGFGKGGSLSVFLGYELIAHYWPIGRLTYEHRF